MRHFLFFLFISLSFLSFSQTDSLKLKTKKGQFYISWGYTKCKFSKSTIHFENTSQKFNERRGLPDNYDFTIYNVTASDRPDLDKIKDVVNVTIPQFVGRI